MKPLLFMPSARDIPAVKKLWHELDYDKLIAKYMTEKDAYATAKQYFVSHTEYTHLVICPDDLEIKTHSLFHMMVLADLHEMPTISGFANIDESHPDVFDLWHDVDLNAEKPPTTRESLYDIETLPETDIRHFEHCGGACRIISRKLFNMLSFRGADIQGKGFFDWQISRELKELGIPNYVDLRARFYHRRLEQKPINSKDCYYYVMN